MMYGIYLEMISSMSPDIRGANPLRHRPDAVATRNTPSGPMLKATW